jgi:hypothetical protein
MFSLKGLLRRKAVAPRPAADDLLMPSRAPVPNAVAEVLDRFFANADERRRVEVWRRNDGFFGFSEEQEFDDEHFGLYWSPVRGSGLYPTHEEALRDARAEIPWLRDSLTSAPL